MIVAENDTFVVAMKNFKEVMFGVHGEIIDKNWNACLAWTRSKIFAKTYFYAHMKI